MRIENAYHQGELLVQERAGELLEGDRNGRVVSDSIIKGALKFIAQQPMVVLGSIDAQQNVWASVLFGQPGFMTAPNDRRVEFDLTRAGIDAHDPFWTNIETNGRIGSLVIELESRRRLRINGQANRSSDDRLTLDVAESYPNCPKYIQRRVLKVESVTPDETLPASVDGQSLGPDQQALIQASDTFFVASAHAERGVDASHRGGPAGFVEIVDERTLRIPDYVGNSMFNTLGNLTVNPRAGLVFVDFDRGQTLQLIGRADILWNREDPANRTGGTQRFWDFRIERWRASGVPASLQWEFMDDSPHHPKPPVDALW